ncbi:MAG: MBL fold metallo-hydrolase [Bacteroidetes bacterium]|nr:MBL fold metallo-hydrolase [Bacteroidota bacterium]
MRNIQIYFLLFMVFLQLSCAKTEDFKVLHELTGGIETNCYLIYGVKSKEAALIDPGGPVDTLITFIKENALDLKYIFITHGHIDHVFGIPDIKRIFPKVKMCMHEDDFNDLFTQKEWAIENYGSEFVDFLKSNPETSKFLDFDMHSLGVPDIFVEDNQTFQLGSLEIKAMHSPGHSPGGICYYTGNILFSGDVLFYRTVGRTDTQHGSTEDQINSVRTLYETFPDSTIVYPGHFQPTDIGSEKTGNERITLDKHNMQ